MNIDCILNFQNAIPQKFFEKLKFLQFFFDKDKNNYYYIGEWYFLLRTLIGY